MNGRLYDPLLHRFLQPDNNIQDPLNSQNYNRYGYAWNNPLRYSDPSGEIIWFVVGLAVIGGTINLATNIAQGNITGSFWEKVGKGFAAFGAGAASGALSIYGPVGWAAGGVIMGGTNAWLAGQDPMQGMMIGGLSGLAGGYLGKWMAPAINSIVVNGIQVSSPMLAGAISGSIGGAAIGGGMGGTMSLIQGGSFGDGFAQGFSTGALSGFVSGAGGGYLSAKANNVNPLSGKSNVKLEPPVNPLLEVKTTETNQSIIKRETSTALAEYFPKNGGALGNWESDFLIPGTEIDRFGSGFGKYFSPRNTPMDMRALPNDNTGTYNAFKVVKPFEVRSSIIAPAFGKIGLGKQYLSPVNMNTLLKREIIIPIK